jgi:uncharacterized membrane protein
MDSKLGGQNCRNVTELVSHLRVMITRWVVVWLFNFQSRLKQGFLRPSFDNILMYSGQCLLGTLGHLMCVPNDLSPFIRAKALQLCFYINLLVTSGLTKYRRYIVQMYRCLVFTDLWLQVRSINSKVFSHHWI